MRLATRDETREIDARAQEEYGLSSEVLMEAAGARAALLLESREPSSLRQIAVVCGPGGNGGDGLVVARHLDSGLRSRGGAHATNITVFVYAPRTKRSPLFVQQLARCRQIGLNIVDLEAKFAALKTLSASTLIIDALFGVGLNTDLDQRHQQIVEAVNDAHAFVVALDTPSGLDVDRGMARGAAVKADETFVFGSAKPGFFMNEGPAHAGRVRVLPIGLPYDLLRTVAASVVGFDEKSCRRALPAFASGAHKTQHGHALILAGGPGMWGAGLLASSSAYRVGAGYVTLASFTEPTEVLRDTPEVLTAQLDDKKLWTSPKWTACGIGPGLGSGEPTIEVLKKLTKLDQPVVIDADAITAVATGKVGRLPSHWIATPHAGELSRVIGVDAKTIEADRLRYAHEGSRKLGCYVLLKGFRTVVSDGHRAQLILSGNSALGKAGTGDVLTGFVTGLLAQNVEPWRAAAAGAYLHGRLADGWLRAGNDKRALEASDLRLNIPSLIARLKGSGPERDP